MGIIGQPIHIKKIEMKNLTTISLILFCLAVTEANAQSIKQLKDEVPQLELKWLKAIEERDTTTIKEILADGFKATYSDGFTETKQELIQRWKKKPFSKDFSIKNVYTYNSRLKIVGNTAKLKGIVVTEENIKGQLIKTEELYEDIYQKVSGVWQVISTRLYKKN
jgi:hypothetical protein